MVPCNINNMFVVCVAPPNVLEETGSEIRPRGCVILIIVYGMYMLQVVPNRWYIIHVLMRRV